MGRLGYRDEQQVARLIEETLTIRLARGAFWPQFLPQLNAALGARVPAAYGLRLTGGRPRVAFVETVGDAFSPRDAMSLWKHVGIKDHHQIRLRFCKDDGLMAWVAAFRPGDQPFTDRERIILRRLAPSLHRRLSIEQQLLTAPLAKAALETGIEALPRSAMVVNRHGEALFSNQLARRRLEADGTGLTETLKACLEGRSQAFTLTRLEVAGALPYHLAVEALKPKDARPMLGVAQDRWSLTPREAQVLQRLAEGLSNRAIALGLSCSRRTVEVHIARLLAKSASESRSQLIARFWSETDPTQNPRGLHAHP